MKILETLKTNAAQHLFETAVVVVLLLVLPILGPHMGKYGGGIAMVAASLIGLIAYFLLYGERLRSRGQLKTAVLLVALSCVLGAAVTVALWLMRSHWH